MNYYSITEEHYAKGCYQYYTDDLKIHFRAIGYTRAEARQQLRKRYPHLDNYHVKFRSRETWK